MPGAAAAGAVPRRRCHVRWLVRGDLDGFFGLMVDNLVQVLLIIALCMSVCGLPADLIFTRMLPGVAISLLIGNMFYGLQAHYMARKYRRADTTGTSLGDLLKEQISSQVSSPWTCG